MLDRALVFTFTLLAIGVAALILHDIGVAIQLAHPAQLCGLTDTPAC